MSHNLARRQAIKGKVRYKNKIMLSTNLLSQIRKIFLDTAPVIYYVERHPGYYPYLKPIFDRIDNNEWQAIVSPITIAECLIVPLRTRNNKGIRTFLDLFESHAAVTCVAIHPSESQEAAKLRAKYNLTLLDAFQVISAIESKCDTFITNDRDVRRITEINVLTLDQLSIL